MNRFVSVFIISNVFIGTGSLNFLARSFAPTANTHRTSYDRRCPSGPFQKKVLATRSTRILHVHSSSPSEDIEVVSSNKIIGPELPPIEDSDKRLFLVRHGEVINPGGDRPVYYGALDVSLSPLGEAEARTAALYLQQFDLDLVVSSPLSRAVFGAEQVLGLQKNNEAAVVKMEDFRELDRGSWCGLTKDEIGLEMMAKFDACDESVTPEGGESYTTLKKRVLQERDAVLDRLSAGKAATIVSHLQVTRSMVSDALGIPTAEMAGLGIATASVTCIDYDADGTQTVHFQSFKPDVGLAKSIDGAN